MSVFLLFVCVFGVYVTGIHELFGEIVVLVVDPTLVVVRYLVLIYRMVAYMNKLVWCLVLIW